MHHALQPLGDADRPVPAAADPLTDQRLVLVDDGGRARGARGIGALFFLRRQLLLQRLLGKLLPALIFILAFELGGAFLFFLLLASVFLRASSSSCARLSATSGLRAVCSGTATACITWSVEGALVQRKPMTASPITTACTSTA